MKESYSSMKASNQPLIHDIKAAVLEKDELEFQVISGLKPLLLLLAYQDFISMVKITFQDI